MVSIQAIKGVAIGEAWEVAGRPGSEAHDEIFWDEERGWYRETNRAGGVEGGMSNGEPLVVAGGDEAALDADPAAALASTSRPSSPAEALEERTDSTTVPAAAVVGEAMVALALARCYREKFGGDHIDDVRAALAAYTRSGSDGGGSDRLRRLHGRRQERGARGPPRGARDRVAATPTT